MHMDVQPNSAPRGLALSLMMWVALTACTHPDSGNESDATTAVKPPPTPIQPERVAPPPVLRELPREPVAVAPQTIDALTVPPRAAREIKALLTAERDEPLVVVHYGDSHTRAAVIADTLRDRVARGGVVSPGYVQPGHPMRWNASVDKDGPWNRHNWLYGRDTPSFGPMGLAYSVTKRKLRRERARMTLQLQRDRPQSGIQVTAYYLLENGHLPFKLTSGRQTLAQIAPPKAHLDAPELGEVTVELPPGAGRLELEVSDCRACGSSAELRFFGFQVHYPNARVTWDALGIGGTTIRSPVHRSDGTMDTYLRRRDADLVVTWFGSNSSVEKGLNLSTYRDNFDALLKRLRSNSPRAACLVLGPPDLDRRPRSDCFLTRDERRIDSKDRKSRSDRSALRRNRGARACNPDKLIRRRGGRVEYPATGVHNRRQWEAYVASCRHRTIPNIPALAKLQHEVAVANGCAYFNVYEYMGGRQSILRWACSEDPQLASTDLVHLTPDGYRKVGNAVADALMTLTAPAANPLEPPAYSSPSP